MKFLINCLFFVILKINLIEAAMVHYTSPVFELKNEATEPFNELILSWNAKRPLNGKFNFYISVKTNEWSPWILYASWGKDGQSSYKNECLEYNVKVYQDALEVINEDAIGYQIKIENEGDALIADIYSLHVYMNSDKIKNTEENFFLPSVYLSVPGLSQMNLNHPRHHHLCSPSSTTAVVRYLTKNLKIDPLEFAKNSWDSGFDIYGNWVFNVAEASSILGQKWNCWVERLSSFKNIHEYLLQDHPVIVSIRGPLTGSALPYSQGHLLVVVGYDPLKQKVICMDPAFPQDDQTQVEYELEEFIQAWNRRGNIAYIFTKKI